MQKISDPKAVQACLMQSHYGEALAGLGAELHLLRYEKGELVTEPLQRERWFLVVVRGALQIYFIRDDGARYALSGGGKDFILGDMDLFGPYAGSVYTEATEPLLCLGLPLAQNRQTMLENNAFLHVVCSSLAGKLLSITALDAAPGSLRERLLSYLRYSCEDGQLQGVEHAAFRLRCSARQLQRILNRLQEEGTVERIGKGAWRLMR